VAQVWVPRRLNPRQDAHGAGVVTPGYRWAQPNHSRFRRRKASSVGSRVPRRRSGRPGDGWRDRPMGGAVSFDDHAGGLTGEVRVDVAGTASFEEHARREGAVPGGAVEGRLVLP